MKNIKTISVLIMLIVFIVFRIQVRSLNLIWVDEIAQINNSVSVNHLLNIYLPNIPGGSPGHYLLVLSVKSLFPNNIVMLYLPGLIGQISVFLFIPKIIEKLRIVQKNKYFRYQL